LKMVNRQQKRGEKETVSKEEFCKYGKGNQF
jgi:hypothetical protein